MLPANHRPLLSLPFALSAACVLACMPSALFYVRRAAGVSGQPDVTTRAGCCAYCACVLTGRPPSAPKGSGR
eukprot:68874-Chlamydomonas_euryale.AAC.1